MPCQQDDSQDARKLLSGNRLCTDSGRLAGHMRVAKAPVTGDMATASGDGARSVAKMLGDALRHEGRASTACAPVLGHAFRNGVWQVFVSHDVFESAVENTAEKIVFITED